MELNELLSRFNNIAELGVTHVYMDEDHVERIAHIVHMGTQNRSRFISNGRFRFSGVSIYSLDEKNQIITRR